MKTTSMIVIALALAVVVGCTSPRGGGMSGGEGFTIVTPVLDTTIKQGETKNVTIALDRGKYFKRDVTLEIKASAGISVEPTQALVRANEKSELPLRITAAKDAALGEYRIYLKGTPEAGEMTMTELKVKVVAP